MNGPRRVLVVFLLVLGVLSAPALALAHPLGNFTINTSASLVVRLAIGQVRGSKPTSA